MSEDQDTPQSSGHPRQDSPTDDRDTMDTSYKTWASLNYGDSGKTKTVTRNKYDRIVRVLSGDDRSSPDNSKFRFWVKSKGFRLGRPGDPQRDVVYVPSASSGHAPSGGDNRVYKRVAIVEDFYDIIYNVHVEIEGRGGKHAGQKRTYRAIAETYSFLPREAVTRFLMSCTDCQKRMHLSSGQQGENNSVAQNHVTKNKPVMDFNMPITTTYMNHLRNRGYLGEDFLYGRDTYDDTMSCESDISVRSNSPGTTEEHLSPALPELKADGAGSGFNSRSSTPASNISPQITPAKEARGSSVMEEAINMTSACTALQFDMRSEQDRIGRKRKASDETSMDSTSIKAEYEDSANKDDDEDDENDDEEKLPPKGIDPERLKSFNMFCRLFVDENLDRVVPISKQPKDKVQAILEACDRQFPEFHERSRKRIRTYLKSCRRMRRSKEANGWEPLRPTPPHLTSAAAESMLANACENESNNAKRMRMGLEPLPASVTNPVTNSSNTTTQSSHSTPAVVHPPSPQVIPAQTHTPTLTPDFLRHAPPAFRPPHELHQPHFFTNGNGLFRPGFPPGFPNPAHHHPQPPVIQQHSPVASHVQNGPTDLSMKAKSNHSKKSQLNPTEVATIKQLIAGYRESAAFLYRSADELEALLLQQN